MNIAPDFRLFLPQLIRQKSIMPQCLAIRYQSTSKAVCEHAAMETNEQEAKPFSQMPGPKGLPYLGNVIDYSKFGKYSTQHLDTMKKDYYKKYGPIFKEKLGLAWFVNIYNIEDITKLYRNEGKFPARGIDDILPSYFEKVEKEEHTLPFMEGQDWWQKRQKVQKLMMAPNAASKYMSLQEPVAIDFAEYITHSVSNESILEDLDQHLLKYTMESFGVVCFGYRFNAFAISGETNQEFINFFEGLDTAFTTMSDSLTNFPWYKFWKTSEYKTYKGAFEIVESFAKKQVEKSKTNDTNSLSTLLFNSGMDTNMVTEMLVTLFSGGVHSTAKAMEFYLYHLAKNPSKQEALYQELKEKLGDLPMEENTINNLRYLKATLRESFRITPPVYPGMVRKLDNDTILGGYMVPKGTTVMANNGTLCRMEEIFPEADKYIPERWMRTPESEKYHTPGVNTAFVTMPFGVGPRNCIGKRFAEQELLLAAAKIVKHFKLEIDPNFNAGYITEVFTRPTEPPRIKFLPRK